MSLAPEIGRILADLFALISHVELGHASVLVYQFKWITKSQKQQPARGSRASYLAGTRRSDKQTIAEYFHATPVPAELPMPGADYNVAPTTFQPIVRQSREPGEREIVLARWGLVPFFTKALSDIKACPPSTPAPNPSRKPPPGASP